MSLSEVTFELAIRGTMSVIYSNKDGTKFAQPIADSDYVQSLDKGLAVIRAFNSDRRAMTLTEVAAVTGLSKPSARRFLLTLQALGYMTQHDGKFRLRPSVLDLGGAYLTSGELPAIVNPFLTELNGELKEACSVGVLDGDSIVYIARASSHKRIMTFDVQVGTRIDPLSTSLGQVILADKSHEDLSTYLEMLRADGSTNIDASNEEIFESLQKVREQGWALMNQGVEVGVRAIAAPLRKSSGEAVAGINVAVHTTRVSLERLQDEFVPRLLATQKKINEALAEYGPEAKFI